MIPEAIKIPFRAILFRVFSQLYDLAKKYFNHQVSLPITILDIYERKR